MKKFVILSLFALIAFVACTAQAESFTSYTNTGVQQGDETAFYRPSCGGSNCMRNNVIGPTGTRQIWFNNSGIFTGASTFVYTADGDVGIGDATPDGTLMLDVAGQIGATEYCDSSGSNCFDYTDITGGSVPTQITVADTTDSTSYCALFESASGDLGPKTDGACLYNASTGVLSSTFSGNLTGAVSGNASTATALFANGSNCSSGNAPLGVDALGSAESCFDVWTQAENNAAAYAPIASPVFTGIVTIPNASAPTTDADGELAVDLDAWGSGRDAIEFFDGTASVYIPGVLASDSCTNGQVIKFNTGGTWTCEDDDNSGGGGGGAPTDATYITQTSNGSLSAEQALSSLSSGIMRVATSTGVITSLTDSAGIAANIGDETGAGALVFGTSPVFTTDATFPNTGLHILDTNASHDLIIAPGSNITADRTLSIVTGDANRSVTLSGDLTVGGTSSINGTAYVASGTDVAVADGGTGSSTAAAAQTALGIRQEYCIALSDQSTDLTTGTGKSNLYLPAAATVDAVRAYTNTAPTGSTIIVDINESGTTLMSSTKLSIDASEKTSGTAASSAALTDTSIAANAEITFDIDQVGSSIKGKGLVACVEVTF